MLRQCPNLVSQSRRVHCASPQKDEWIEPLDQWKLQLSECSVSLCCSKAVSQNHHLNQLINGIYCAFLNNQLLASLVIDYISRMHSKPLIKPYVHSNHLSHSRSTTHVKYLVAITTTKRKNKVFTMQCNQSWSTGSERKENGLKRNCNQYQYRYCEWLCTQGLKFGGSVTPFYRTLKAGC